MTGDDIKAWRKRLHLTQQQAADAIGCSNTALKNWERDGSRELPKWVAMAAGAVAYNLPPYPGGKS
jgi:transcriptional regulator with XRE-family HTH domain